jgi:hypothetical protein
MGKGKKSETTSCIVLCGYVLCNGHQFCNFFMGLGMSRNRVLLSVLSGLGLEGLISCA